MRIFVDETTALFNEQSSTGCYGISVQLKDLPAKDIANLLYCKIREDIKERLYKCINFMILLQH